MSRLTLIVATLGRGAPLERLFQSLESQTFSDFDVIVVDQNDDSSVVGPIVARHWSFPINWVRTPGQRGLSRARNVGIGAAGGEVLLFPDDDCWYPPHFLETGLRLLVEQAADILTGRSAFPDGRDVNGRYSRTARRVTRANVWTCQIEWVTFVRRAVFDQIGGYDEGLGIGSAGPYQAAEGPDLLLRALDAGCTIHYDPSLAGHHDPYQLYDPDRATIEKARTYGRGMGGVLRRHGYSRIKLIYWLGRSAFNVGRELILGRLDRARYFSAVFLGRWEGWMEMKRTRDHTVK